MSWGHLVLDAGSGHCTLPDEVLEAPCLGRGPFSPGGPALGSDCTNPKERGSGHLWVRQQRWEQHRHLLPWPSWRPPSLHLAVSISPAVATTGEPASGQTFTRERPLPIALHCQNFPLQRSGYIPFTKTIQSRRVSALQGKE